MKKLCCLLLSAALLLLADGGVSGAYSVRMPDGSYDDLLTLAFGEGVTLEELSGGGAERLSGAHTLAWNGERFYSFSVRAENCAIPNLSPSDGGGELVVPGGADAVALDAGNLSVTGGTVREP